MKFQTFYESDPKSLEKTKKINIKDEDVQDVLGVPSSHGNALTGNAIGYMKKPFMKSAKKKLKIDVNLQKE